MEDQKYLIFFGIVLLSDKTQKSTDMPIRSDSQAKRCSGGSKGGGKVCGPPPVGSKFFQFHAVFGNIWQNRMLVPPPGGLVPPPRRNPGSATKMFVSSRSNSFQLHATILVGAPV